MVYNKHAHLRGLPVTHDSLRFTQGARWPGAQIVPADERTLVPAPPAGSHTVGLAILAHTRGVLGRGCGRTNNGRIKHFENTVVFMGIHEGARVYDRCTNCGISNLRAAESGATPALGYLPDPKFCVAITTKQARLVHRLEPRRSHRR